MAQHVATRRAEMELDALKGRFLDRMLWIRREAQALSPGDPRWNTQGMHTVMCKYNGLDAGWRAALELVRAHFDRVDLWELIQLGRPDLTVEYWMLQSEFEHLFDPQDRALARRNLEALGWSETR